MMRGRRKWRRGGAPQSGRLVRTFSRLSGSGFFTEAVEEALLGCEVEKLFDSTLQPRLDVTTQLNVYPADVKGTVRVRFRCHRKFPRGVQRISPGFTHHNPRIQPHHILSEPPRPGRHRRQVVSPLRTARTHMPCLMIPVHVTTNNTRATYRYSIDTSPSRPPPYIKAMARL